jgi:hypothetical protein
LGECAHGLLRSALAVLVGRRILRWPRVADRRAQLQRYRRFTPSFYATAQFIDFGKTYTHQGDIIDPLEGVDDCGIFKNSGGGVRGKDSYHDVADVQLLDGEVSRPLVEIGNGIGGLHSYFLDLGAESVEPRYGERYGRTFASARGHRRGDTPFHARSGV